eukprot:Skav213391  [mRNA]  locus=scaffold797:406473:412492:+ [translate_table: standard]
MDTSTSFNGPFVSSTVTKGFRACGIRSSTLKPSSGKKSASCCTAWHMAAFGVIRVGSEGSAGSPCIRNWLSL